MFFLFSAITLTDKQLTLLYDFSPARGYERHVICSLLLLNVYCYATVHILLRNPADAYAAVNSNHFFLIRQK